ncbi:uncharacterized protein KY384_001500 [Bacidia gigantensis]|uniref:uncharacterized protein n=1 Tax=Bacidia gigantensis TaxID=2732470 RepID=UPI001D04B342|nr:uncharacterized protein KY384_001500 [Bacidia gigantensis]KAG8533759.1 hypothetical protein KY384_001500 [Bacidia gigantensis]
MADAIHEIPVSVFLPGKMVLTQANMDYQIAHAGDFNCEGLNTFTITLMSIVTAAVGMRLWARRIAKIDLKIDDYILLVGWVRVQSSKFTQVHTDFCAAFPVNSNWNRKYKSKTLLLLSLQLNLKFPPAGFKATRQIDGKQLFLANCGFNIATDTILLFLPMVVIWGLNKDRRYKLALSAIFCLGVLTVVASVARLVYYYKFDANDPMCEFRCLAPTALLSLLGRTAHNSVTPLNFPSTNDTAHTIGGLPTSQFWTITEMNLGLLCPCLVTFGPLIRQGYVAFPYVLEKRKDRKLLDKYLHTMEDYRMCYPHLSPSARERIERITGTTTTYVNDSQALKPEFSAKRSSFAKINDDGFQPPLRSKPSQLEAGTYAAHEVVPPIPRDQNGMAIHQDIALANLDPRTKALEHERGQRHKRMGTSTNAVADQPSNDVPTRGIGISRDWRLDSE